MKFLNALILLSFVTPTLAFLPPIPATPVSVLNAVGKKGSYNIALLEGDGIGELPGNPNWT